MIKFIQADARHLPLAPKSVQMCVTSPPYYGLRDYGAEGQIGLEQTPAEYVANMVQVFRGVREVLRDDGVLWLNIGDSYSTQPKGNPGALSTGLTNGGRNAARANAHRSAVDTSRLPGIKAKDLIGIPWMLAFALRDDGWYLRSDCIWAKPNPMPESTKDRPTRAHEYLFLLTKSPTYFCDMRAIEEAAVTAGKPIKMADGWDTGPGGHGTFHRDGREKGKSHGAVQRFGRNKRSVWTVPTAPCKSAHFATFPPKLIEPCILAGTSAKGCCPACGAPWTRIVERKRQATRPGLTGKMAERAELANGSASKGRDGIYTGNRDPQRHVTTTTTIGWQPSCKCDAGEPIPCTVLDCFNGAGTTALVCHQHGRSYVGTELNPEYIGISRHRLAEFVEKLARGGAKRARKPRKPAAPLLIQPSLFQTEVA